MKIVVTTCRAYAHLLDDFDFLFKKFWGVPYEVIGADNDDGLSGYSDNLIAGLRDLTDEFVILLHEDFYITEPVDHARILRLREFAKENGMDRVSLQCIKDGYEGFVTSLGDRLYKVNEGFQYIASFEASIWNRETLLRILFPREDPWQTELRCSSRNPTFNAVIPEIPVLIYHDARIHGQERIRVIDGSFHKLTGEDANGPIWEDLGVKRANYVPGSIEFYEHRLRVAKANGEDEREAVWASNPDDYRRVECETKQILARYLKPGMSLLDAGCGIGELSECLPDGVMYTGVDFVNGFIDEARKRYPEKQFFVRNLLNLTYSPDLFDFAVCRHVEGTMGQDWPQAEKELLRVAKTLLVMRAGDKPGDTLASLVIKGEQP